MIAYYPGFRFRVFAHYADGKLVSYPALWASRWAARTYAHLPVAVLEDGEPVETLANHNGAVVVRVIRTGDEGYLG